MSLTHQDILAGGRYRGVCLAAADRPRLLRLYRFMLRLRTVEETIAREYHPADEMACPVHLCIGQESVPAALSELLGPEDYLFSHHRSHGYYLAKHAPLPSLLAELFGRQTGTNGGLAGSQDVSAHEQRFFGGAILTGAIGVAVGAALAIKMRNLPGIAAAGFGEGAADEGLFWEVVNYAALQQLPLLLVCENNKYATYSPQSARQFRDNLSEKVAAFGVPSRDLFGNDAAAVYACLEEAVGRMRRGGGPFFLQAYTYRWNSHVGPEDDSGVGYRSAAEKELWRQNCPIGLLEEKLLEEGILDRPAQARMRGEIEAEIAAALAFARQSPFPGPPDWTAMNESCSSPRADALLADDRDHHFDGSQEEAVPGPY